MRGTENKRGREKRRGIRMRKKRGKNGLRKMVVCVCVRDKRRGVGKRETEVG